MTGPVPMGAPAPAVGVAAPVAAAPVPAPTPADPAAQQPVVAEDGQAAEPSPDQDLLAMQMSARYSIVKRTEGESGAASTPPSEAAPAAPPAQSTGPAAAQQQTLPSTSG